jgi:hypothetical protein
MNPVKNVVLVHGAWADGSSYAKIIPLLEGAGLHVIAVQNPDDNKTLYLIGVTTGRSRIVRRYEVEAHLALAP